MGHMKEEFAEGMELWPVETEGRDLDEKDLYALQIQVITDLLEQEITEIEKILDRVTYYGEDIKKEDLELLRKRLKHIVKNYS